MTANPIGMSVPGASALYGGLNQDAETEEQRRKRLLAQQQSRLMSQPGVSSLMPNPGAGYGVALS